MLQASREIQCFIIWMVKMNYYFGWIFFHYQPTQNSLHLDQPIVCFFQKKEKGKTFKNSIQFLKQEQKAFLSFSQFSRYLIQSSLTQAWIESFTFDDIHLFNGLSMNLHKLWGQQIYCFFWFGMLCWFGYNAYTNVNFSLGLL